MALPALRAQSETTPDLRSVVARLDAHFEQVDATAVQQLDRPLGYAILGSATAAAGMIAVPAAGAWGGSFYASGTTAHIAASSGAGFVTGGSFGLPIEFALNEMTGSQHTLGGYTAAFVGGGVGGTGLRLLPRSLVRTTIGRAVNGFLTGAFSGASGNSVGQLVTTSGDLSRIDYNQFLWSTASGGIVGSLTPMLDVRINGVSLGRNNAMSTYQGLQTRMNSGDIARMRLRYSVNNGAATVVQGSGRQVVGAALERVRQ
jgi:hypothetical protein